jgi:hypothetical protein
MSAHSPTRVTKTPAPASYFAIRVLDPTGLTDCGTGEYTITVGACELLREDGSPSQEGDVLSVQRDGSLQTRPAGTSGSFERLVKTAAGAVYRPDGPGGITVLLPLAQDVPNK